MSWKPKDTISAKQLIERAQENLDQIKHWLNPTSLHIAVQRATAAKTIIEILEVMHCGSVGGLTCGFPVGQDGLQKRLDHLKKVFL